MNIEKLKNFVDGNGITHQKVKFTDLEQYKQELSGNLLFFKKNIEQVISDLKEFQVGLMNDRYTRLSERNAVVLNIMSYISSLTDKLSVSYLESEETYLSKMKQVLDNIAKGENSENQLLNVMISNLEEFYQDYYKNEKRYITAIEHLIVDNVQELEFCISSDSGLIDCVIGKKSVLTKYMAFINIAYSKFLK